MIALIQQNQSSFVRHSQFSDFLVSKVSYDSYRVSAAKMNHVKPFNLFLGRKKSFLSLTCEDTCVRQTIACRDQDFYRLSYHMK